MRDWTGRAAIEEEIRKEYGDLIAQHNRNAVAHRKELEELGKKCQLLQEDAEKGRAFQAMLDQIKKNTLTKSAWDKFLLTLRMTGMDGTND
jgi:vacuolar-type H+-ATPase subunit H